MESGFRTHSGRNLIDLERRDMRLYNEVVVLGSNIEKRLTLFDNAA